MATKLIKYKDHYELLKLFATINDMADAAEEADRRIQRGEMNFKQASAFLENYLESKNVYIRSA